MEYETFIKACHEIDHILREVKRPKGRTNWPEPVTLRAAALRIISEKRGLMIRVNDLWQIYGVTAPNINRAKRYILKALEDARRREQETEVEIHHEMPSGREIRIRKWRGRSPKKIDSLI